MPLSPAQSFLRRENIRMHKEALDQRDPLGTPKLQEECGIFGIIGHAEASAKIALGLHALQHRGQEAAGIVTTHQKQFIQVRHTGLVSNHFHDSHVLDTLKGTAGIGHTRYSTMGGKQPVNIQPLYADLDRGGIALAHNGTLTNAKTIRQDLMRKGCIFHTTSDTENFLQLAALSRELTLVDKLTDSLRSIEGAYALCALTQHALIGVRDPLGIRPLVIGKLDQAIVLASETCALDLIGATHIRDVAPGEMVICKADGTFESRQVFEKKATARPCIFELIYFARPNSCVDGRSVYDLRKRLGKKLAKEKPVIGADLVCPVPDSGIAAAIGFAQHSGLPYEMGLIRGHYAGRTFIQPDQKIREAGVARKHSANRAVVYAKRVVLIDDSLVRGTTARKIVTMLRDAGAAEVHFRIACPPIKFPDFYGIDTPSREELLAAKLSESQMCDAIGADSLEFLSLDGIYTAFGKGPRDAKAPAFTDHCFTGDYPTALTDQTIEQSSASVQQLSFLAS